MNILLVLPLTTPEMVLGSSLLTLFLDLNVPTGFATIVHRPHHVLGELRGAHGEGPDPRLRLDPRGGRDGPGGDPFRAFLKVTLPLIAPGIVAAAMLSFALSLDDFIITLFNAGNRDHLPAVRLRRRRAAFPPQINVLATAILS